MSPRYAALGVIGLTLALAYGIWYSYSVILVALLGEFGWSRSVLAGAFSVFTLVHGAVNPLIGAACARFKPLRVMAGGGALMGLALFADSFIGSPLELYLAFGVLTALGVAAAGWVPGLVYVQREFRDRVGFAIGIISAGIGVGMMLLIPLIQVFIDAFGWRAAFRVLALMSVAWIVPSSLWLMHARSEHESRGQSPRKEKSDSDPHRTSDSDPHRTPDSDPHRTSDSGPRPATADMTLREAARTQAFWLLMAAYFFGNIASQTLHVHQVAFLVDHGLAAIVAASVVGVVGLASIVGKAGGGWLSDRVERERVYVAGIVLLVAGALVLLSLGRPPALWAAYGYAVLLGVGYSATAAITPAMVSDRFSGPHFGAIVGVGLMSSAAASAFGPWMAGHLFDTTGSYTVALLIAAGCGVVAGAAGWQVGVLRRTEKAKRAQY